MNKKILGINLIQIMIGFGFLIAFRIGGFSTASFFLGPTQIFLLLIPLNLIWIVFNVILIVTYQARHKVDTYFKWLALGFTIGSGLINATLPYFYMVAATNLQILVFVLWFSYFVILFGLVYYEPIIILINKKKNKKSTTK